MKWTDIYDIAASLEDNHPEVNVETVRFTELRAWVLDLDGFEDEPTHCSEKILEAIQLAWLEERQ